MSLIASSLLLFLSIFNVSIRYGPFVTGSTSAISNEEIFYSRILSRFSWLINDPDFKKTSLLTGSDKSFFIYFPNR